MQLLLVVINNTVCGAARVVFLLFLKQRFSKSWLQNTQYDL